MPLEDDIIPDDRVVASETRWVWIVAGVMTFMLAIVVIGALASALQPPSNVEAIDPTRVHLDGEFVESNLGTAEAEDGGVLVRLIAQQFSFSPPCLEVPVDRPVTIRATSPDVIHGLIVTGTNVNTMVVPGYVSEVHTRFGRTGEYLIPCHEFCGLGHQGMWGRLRVVDEATWRADVAAAPGGRVSCTVQNG